MISYLKESKKKKKLNMEILNFIILFIITTIKQLYDR